MIERPSRKNGTAILQGKPNNITAKRASGTVLFFVVLDKIQGYFFILPLSESAINHSFSLDKNDNI